MIVWVNLYVVKIGFRFVILIGEPLKEILKLLKSKQTIYKFSLDLSVEFIINYADFRHLLT